MADSKQRVKLLQQLQSLGEDTSMEELVFHLDKMVSLLQEIKNSSGNNDTSALESKIDSLKSELVSAIQANKPEGDTVAAIESLRETIIQSRPKDIDLSPVAHAISGLPGKDESTKQSGYLIKIGDSFLDLKNKLDELKTPTIDTGYKQVVKAILDLEKKLTGSFGGLEKQLKITVSGSSGTGGYDLPPNVPAIQNITLTSSSSEYPVTIPLGTKRLNIKIRGLNGYRLLWGWNSGDIITNNKYMTLEQGETNLFSGIRFLHNTTIYINCPDANSQVAEVETWTS